MGPLLKLKGTKGEKPGPLRKKDKTPLVWTDEARQAFATFKEKMCTTVTLSFPNFELPCVLTTDASNECIGGVLQQRTGNDNALRPLSFFSRKLNSAERNYSTTQREALAVIYGLQVNRPLILGYPIEIHTDHRSLVWLLQAVNPSGRIARWQTLLSEYDFTVSYLPGKENVVADFLYRMRVQEDTETTLDESHGCINTERPLGKGQAQDEKKDISRVVTMKSMRTMRNVSNVRNSRMAQASDQEMIPNENNKSNDSDVQDDEHSTKHEDRRDDKGNIPVEWNINEIRQLQDVHPAYKIVKGMMTSRRDVKSIEDELKRNKCSLKVPIEELVLEEGLLYRKRVNEYEEVSRAIILPPEYSLRAIALAHSVPTAGHGGAKVTFARCQKFAYWPGMKKDVEDYVRKCVVCSRFKKLGNYHPAPLRHYPDATAPFERVHVDLVGPMGTSDNGYKYVMTIIMFSRGT